MTREELTQKLVDQFQKALSNCSMEQLKDFEKNGVTIGHSVGEEAGGRLSLKPTISKIL